MMLGVCRVQRYVSQLCEKAEADVPEGKLRTVLRLLLRENVLLEMEPLRETPRQTCELTTFTTECVCLKLNHQRFTVSRLMLVSLFRCYAFAHVVEKLTQHAAARADEFAYATWREDERQLRLFLS